MAGVRVKLVHTPDDPVRLSFPDLFEAVQYEGKGEFRYNASFLVVPGRDNDKRIQAAIREAAAEAFGKKADAKLAEFKGQSQKFCYISGDTKDYDGYKGMLVLSAHRKQKDGRPTVLDGNKSPLTAADGQLYAGCYVNGSVDIYAQDTANPGIRCGLRGVQKAADGDAFSGSSVADPDEFDDIGAPEGSDDSLA